MLTDVFKDKSVDQDIKIGILLILILPISLLIGSFIININVLFIDLIFLYSYFSRPRGNFFNTKFNYLIVFFLITILLNIFLNTGENFSYDRQVSFLRFAILPFAICFFLDFSKLKYFKYILNIWTIIFLIVTFDLFFEFIFGYNILGNSSYMPGRLASFQGEELKIGGFYFGFIMLITAYILNNYKNKLLIFCLIFVFIIGSIIIGERSNLIKIFISFIIFYTLYEKIKFNKKILFFLIFLFFFFLITLFNPTYKTRYYGQFLAPITDKGIYQSIVSSHYGVHYQTAIEIFNENKFFGIGFKQFRFESSKEKYDKKINNPNNRDNWATHPHQIHFEFLSEAGLFGYLSFIFFIFLSILISFKNYLKKKNIYLLASLSFLISFTIPVIPSGSFFSTYSATIFWINYSILVFLQNSKK